MNPSEISKVTINFDLDNANRKFAANPKGNQIQMGSFKNDGCPLLLKFNGTAEMDNFFVSLAFDKKNFSMPMALNDKATLVEVFDVFASKVQETVPNWTVTHPFERDAFWLRLNFDQKTKKFKTVSNLGFDSAKAVEKLTGLKDRLMTVTVEVRPWFNMKDEKAGVSMNVFNVNFD